MNEKVIIVEDDESIRLLLEVTLKSQGYNVLGFSAAAEALAEMNKEAPAVVVMDIMMKGMDGVEAVKRMRQNARLKALPVIMLTARDTELDKILGLDAGADDYMTKPFSVLELCARVRAQIRRGAGQDQTLPLVFEYGGLRLDAEAHTVKHDGKPVELTVKEFDLLRALMENRGKVLSRQELLERVWGYDYWGETRTLDMHIGTLRQKINDAADNSRYIKTVRGVGYRFD